MKKSVIILKLFLAIQPSFAQTIDHRIIKLKEMPSMGQDRGGGNSVNNMIIEGYATNLEKIEGYLLIAQPIIEKIKGNFPNLATELDRSTARLTWFMLPTEQKHISKDTTGAPDRSVQVATQDLFNDEVFIDTNEFKQHDLKNKGAYLLHEIFLDLRCWSGKNCSIEDHAKVRKLVATLMSSNDFAKWKAALSNLFMVYSSFPGEYARLVFTSNEESAYEKVYTKWKELLHQECLEIHSGEVDPGSAIASALSRVSDQFLTSENCAGNMKDICKGLPTDVWNIYSANRYEIYTALKCKGY